MNRYQPTGEYGEAVYGPDVVELELSPTEEADLVSAGHLKLVERAYLQLSDNYSAAQQGETFTAAFPVEVEAALVSGGHIKRVDPAPKPAAKKAAAKKATTRKRSN